MTDEDFRTKLRCFRAGFLIALTTLTACATTTEPSWSEPKVVPAGWIADYDYKSEIWTYLQRQYDNARLEGTTAYVYLFSDSDRHCLEIREMMRIEVVAAAFRGTRITMLNYDRFKWSQRQDSGVGFDPGNWEPVIVKISNNGYLTRAITYPDLSVFHSDPSELPSRRSIPESRDKKIRRLAEKMLEFFQANNES